MAATQKSYFLSPSWNLEPTEVSLGSVIANLRTPNKALSAENLPAAVDSVIHTGTADFFSGTAKSSRNWSIGLFSTFIHVITIGGEASYSSTATSVVEYSCDLMETKRFTPSSNYITKAVNDDSVKAHLTIGGWGAKVFLITGVKTAQGVTITTTEEMAGDTNAQIGVDIPAAQLTVGPKLTRNNSTLQTHTIRIPGPIVFAFEVTKLRVNRKGQATSRDCVNGAVLSRPDDDDDDINYTIEQGGNDLDEEEYEDFELVSFSGVDDETGEACQIAFPSPE